MNKKAIAAVLGCAIVTGILLPVTACFEGGGNTNKGDRETNVTITSNGAQVTWNKVEGAKSYEIFYSPGRFGTYKSVKTQTSCKYTGKDKYGYYRVVALDDEGGELSSNLYSYDIETFGNDTRVYSATDDTEAVQADIEEFYDATSQFGEGRFAALFKPGDYSDLDLKMRYYMTFAGLGDLPTDVVIGKFNTYGQLANGNATCNFWWGAENFTVNDTVQWAVSQATSFRRMKVNGNLNLYDTGYSKGNYASGGFIADTVITGTVNTGTQQQWFTRNSKYGKWSGCNINMVFSGCEGSFADGKYNWSSNRNITELATTGVMREKPYLMFDRDYYVCVPQLKENSKGISWTDSIDDYDYSNEYINLNKFYVARADRDNSSTLNAALKQGKHLLFTAGIYNIDSPLLVKNKDTIIMGIGLASLRVTAKNTDTLMRVADVDGVKISGLMFDAGPSSKTLLELGTEKTSVSHKHNPTILNDVYFRIGGAGSGETCVDKAFVINSNNVVGDNFWVWRADHGNSGTVGWNVNRAKSGVIVNGNNVTIYGLMVEHFQQYQTVWNGENGFMAFYQSETPYDPPEQSDWMSQWKDTTYEGYASYKVADGVQNHEAYGLGVYYVASSRLKNVFNLDHGVELPSNAGIHVEHIAIANFLSYGDKKTNGGIRHIVNSYGTSNFDGSQQRWQSFIGGIATP